MTEYTVNKGVGRPVELYGLKGPYLFAAAIGLGIIFIVGVVLFMSSSPFMFNIIFLIVSCIGLCYALFKLNKHGIGGIDSKIAHSWRPAYLKNSQRINNIIRKK